tara:strand:- start:84 stop:527 length:444 start_codon:yes stop_codon:yes gene_type:complete
MTTVNIYLTFEGNCREAFEFYKKVFKTEFSSVNTFGEMPTQHGTPVLTEEQKAKIMHITLPISNQTTIMGCDSGNWGPRIIQGNNFSISVHPTNKSEADRIFLALSENGEITMPIVKTFWNSYFGMLKDKFGINWMVNLNLTPTSPE